MLKKIGLSLATLFIGAVAAHAQQTLSVSINGVVTPCVPSDPCTVTTGTQIQINLFGLANSAVVVNRTHFLPGGGETTDTVDLGITASNGFYQFNGTYGCDQSVVGSWTEQWTVGGVATNPATLEIIVTTNPEVCG